MDLLLGFFSALCISMVLVPLLMRYASNLRLIDEPLDERKIHEVPIPRCGGIAIAVGSLFPAIFWLPLKDEYLALAVGTLIILIFGLADDIKNLNYRWKFFGQILAALVLLVGGIGFERVPFFGLDAAPVWISWPLTFFFVVGVTNAVNLSDGLDGLAAGTALLSLIAIAVLGMQISEPQISLVAIAVVGGLLGFLRYNTHPAQIFMGDMGSQFLGFVTAALALMVTQHELSSVSALLPVLILGLPILDTLSVIAIRLVRRRVIFHPDRSHLHHQLMRAGFRHYEAVAALYFLQIILVFLLYQMRFESDLALLTAYVIFCASILGFIAWTRGANWRLHANREGLGKKERRNQWVRKMTFLHQHSTTMIEWALALFLVLVGIGIEFQSPQIAKFTLMMALVLVAYRVVQEIFPFRARLVVRGGIYITCIVAVYVLLTGQAPRPAFNAAIDVYLIALTCLLMLAIRTTRKDLFRLNNQDYLVVLIVLLTPLLPTMPDNGFEIGRFVLRVAVLLYACEFVISKRKGLQPVLFSASILCLLSIGLF